MSKTNPRSAKRSGDTSPVPVPAPTAVRSIELTEEESQGIRPSPAGTPYDTNAGEVLRNLGDSPDRARRTPIDQEPRTGPDRISTFEPPVSDMEVELREADETLSQVLDQPPVPEPMRREDPPEELSRRFDLLPQQVAQTGLNPQRGTTEHHRYRLVDLLHPEQDHQGPCYPIPDAEAMREFLAETVFQTNISMSPIQNHNTVETPLDRTLRHYARGRFIPVARSLRDHSLALLGAGGSVCPASISIVSFPESDPENLHNYIAIWSDDEQRQFNTTMHTIIVTPRFLNGS